MGSCCAASTAIALWLLAALACGCSNSSRGGLRLPDEPRLQRATAGAGTWSRVDASTLRFEGAITAQSWNGFAAIVDASTRRIVVNSGGGDVAAAVRVAQRIRAAHIELVVDGYCLSSCANYWAVASPNTTLQDGVIGYHGNLTGCVQLSGGLAPYVAKDLPRDASQEKLDQVAAQVRDAIALEEGFYGRDGMPAGLPVEYCRADKGFANGKIFSYIAPNEDRLRAIGVHLNAGSKQSKARIAEYNAHFKNPIICY
jgi:hypothetical protein